MRPVGPRRPRWKSPVMPRGGRCVGPPPADVLETFGGAAAPLRVTRLLTAVAAPLTREAFVRDYVARRCCAPERADGRELGGPRLTRTRRGGGGRRHHRRSAKRTGQGRRGQRAHEAARLSGDAVAVGVANASAPPSFVFDEARSPAAARSPPTRRPTPAL